MIGAPPAKPMIASRLYKKAPRFYIPRMRCILGAWVLLVPLCAGCQSTSPLKLDTEDQALFSVARMRLHPIFTQVRNWTPSKHPDGIQAELEFQDQFGDPTKASGTVRFELFPYIRGHADPRGDRVAMWEGSLLSIEEQYLRWNKTSRTYTFQLAYSKINLYGNYVLTATFQNSDGRRFFSRVILEGLPQTIKGKTYPHEGVTPFGPTSLPIFPPASAPTTLPLLPSEKP